MPQTDAASAAREPVRFSFGLNDLVVADSNAGNGEFTVRGHAAVFNRPSHDLGGFRYKIAPGAFDRALDANPDVHLVIGHNMDLVLARTLAKTLELRVDPVGLHMWARVAPTSYALDLRMLMERGDVDQMSFAGYIDADEWHVSEDGEVTCAILEFSELLDATICPQGAFPQTDASLVAASRAHFTRALESGRIPDLAADRASGQAGDENPAEPPEGDGSAAAATVSDGHDKLRDYVRVSLDLARASTPKE